MKTILLRRFLVLFSGLFILLTYSQAQTKGFCVKGIVVDSNSGSPLEGVVVYIDELWAVSNSNGEFAINRIQSGTYDLKANLLGYAQFKLNIKINRDIDNFQIRLKENTLALKDVVVTAKRSHEGTGTTHDIGRDALNHLQLSSVTNMSALLPGGKTINPDLTSSSSFSVRSAGSTLGNAAFSTAVEVDGVRLGANAAFSEMTGVDTRSISVDNVESVEVISGVPSAEYGDLGSGMVRIHTKRGRAPVSLSLSCNPRTYQSSVSGGFDLGANFGVLNLNAEWARATKKLTSPYESYTRRAIGAVWSHSFASKVRVEIGINGNLGGMNSEDDPDAFTGQFSRASDNALRGNASVNIQINRPWATALKLDAYVNYADHYSLLHKYNSASSRLPAVHAESDGLNIATLLPQGEYFSDRVEDSRELDAGASLKYTLDSRFGAYRNLFKAGLQWKCSGNVGEGEFYLDPALAQDGYRPRPYSQYPFMHTLSGYVEDDFTMPIGLRITAGLRYDRVLIEGSRYQNVASLSPRLNVKWKLNKKLTLRGGWGLSEKLPSFFTLYPKQEYRDILVKGTTDASGLPEYLYYTKSCPIEYNPSLKWQQNRNSEIGVDANFWGINLSLVGFYNITANPYKFANNYLAVEFDRGGFIDKTFVEVKRQENGADVKRMGLEFTVDFPQIEIIKTNLRLDAAYGWTMSQDDSEYYYYNKGWSHPTLTSRSYPYVGIYKNGGNSNLMIKGRKSSSLNANLTSITHIPEARLIITCRLETSLFTRSLNIPTGDTDVLYPVAYLDVEDGGGFVHPFTARHKDDPAFSDLVIRPTNDYLFKQDGYGAYMSANLSVTKEIGNKVSLSFFANNFTFSRPYVVSMATGVGAILTPSFYYGLTCRIKM